MNVRLLYQDTIKFENRVFDNTDLSQFAPSACSAWRRVQSREVGAEEGECLIL